MRGKGFFDGQEMSYRIVQPLAPYFCAIFLLAPLMVGCGSSGSDQVAIRLVDVFEPAAVEGGRSGEVALPPRTEWRFDGPAPELETLAETRGWEAGPGVAELAVRDGRLVGRTTSDFPILRVERTSGLDSEDHLHAIEIRLRVSAGSNLEVATRSEESVDLVEVPTQLRESLSRITTPILPGDELQTYTLTGATPIVASTIRHLLIRPTDVEGASFEIESVRLIFRKEHLASVPSGIGWQGLQEIYRESLVARAPETLRFNLDLPPNPWLDLTVGTLEERPVTFRVSVGRPNASGETVVLEHTVTRAYRWESRPVDLTEFGRQSVSLSLSLVSEEEGALGFWGSPVVRDSGAVPSPIEQAEAPPSSAGGLAVQPQGVILIQADTLRRDRLDVYGYERETAPVLRRMAAEGALFRRTTAPATWTKVSTPSLMTSLYPSSHGVLDFPDRLPASAITLTELYRQAGYATVAYSSVLFTGQFSNMHQGFEELHESGSTSDSQPSKTAREYVDRLVDWLERHRSDPFFVFLHVFDPHDPYEPYRPYDSLWADPSHKEEHTRQLEEVRKFIDEPLLKQFGMPTRDALEQAGIDPDAYVAHDGDWYDGAIRGMDVEIGRLLERLRGLGLDDKTLVIFTSDHGEEFLEHGRMFHGQTVYGELTQVPLIIRWPGAIPAGVVIDESVQTIDLMPTLLDVSRLPHPNGLQGQSLVPLLVTAGGSELGSVRPWRPRPAVSEKALTQDVSGPPPHDTESYAIMDEGWKLIYNKTRPPGSPEYELYDAERDPLDQIDLAAQNPEVVERLAKALEAWHELALAARLEPDSEAVQDLSQEQLERLRSLGYIR